MSGCRFHLTFMLVSTVGSLILTGCSVGSLPSNSGPIQHVVVIFQENRTPDNLFQDPVLIARGADIASSGTNSKGQIIPLIPIDLGTTGSNPQNYDLSHTHSAFVSMYDGGKMDGADLITCLPAANCPADSNPQFKYVKRMRPAKCTVDRVWGGRLGYFALLAA
jgi:hypothetical protein